MENNKDYKKCTWKDCEKCNEMPCRKAILKMLSKKERTSGKKENRITQLKKERLELLETLNLNIYGGEICRESTENKLKEIDKKIKELENGKI